MSLCVEQISYHYIFERKIKLYLKYFPSNSSTYEKKQFCSFRVVLVTGMVMSVTMMMMLMKIIILLGMTEVIGL